MVTSAVNKVNLTWFEVAFKQCMLGLILTEWKFFIGQKSVKHNQNALLSTRNPGPPNKPINWTWWRPNVYPKLKVHYEFLHGFSVISFLSKIVGISLWLASCLPPEYIVKKPGLWRQHRGCKRQTNTRGTGWAPKYNKPFQPITSKMVGGGVGANRVE